MRILIAEDETRMAAALKELLMQEGYAADCFYNGSSALLALENNLYDVAVVDVMMPAMNGFQVVQAAREKGIQTPIMLLTAKSQLEDKISGLDYGADDYLTKPFETKELLARLRALGRRAGTYKDERVSFGDLILDTSSAMLKCLGTNQDIRLSEKEMKILEYLFTNQKRIVTREQLTVKIWGYDNEAEYNNVEVYLSFTRKKLSFIGSKVEIKAVRGLGYELRYIDV